MSITVGQFLILAAAAFATTGLLTWPVMELVILMMLLTVHLLHTSLAVFSRLARGLSPLAGGKDQLLRRLVRADLISRAAAFSLSSVAGTSLVMAILV